MKRLSILFVIIMCTLSPLNAVPVSSILLNAWEVSIVSGPSMVSVNDSFLFSFPVAINTAFRVGLTGLWVTPSIGVETKVLATGLSAEDLHLMVGVSAGFRRVLTTTLYYDFFSDLGENSIMGLFNVIEISALLMKYFIRIKNNSGFFIDLRYNVLSIKDPDYYDGTASHSLVLSFSYTNDCRTGWLGAGFLFYLSPFFWMDRSKYMDDLL